MKRRLVVDLVLVEPPEGVFAGLGPREYPSRVAQQIAGLLAQLGKDGVGVEAFSVGNPIAGTRPPNPMVGRRLPSGALVVSEWDPETGELLT